LSAPDVGGSGGAMSQYMSLRGGSVSSANNTVMVDGMVINGLQSDGAVQTYINDADFQEMTYQTAGIGAERSGGGVTLNMVPKEGGNRLSGDGTSAYRPGQLQGDNYSQRLKDWGFARDVKGNPVINRIDHIYDFTASEGGPLKKDKLWFFLSGRASAPVNTVPNTFLDDGTQGLDDNYIRQSLLRLTYQVSPRHKIGAYYERVYKWRGHDMGAFADPETTAGIWTSPNYSTAAAKYTGTLSSRLLVEGGYSQNVEFYRVLMQPGIMKERGTPEWYSVIAHTATGGGAGVARATTTKSYPVSQVLQGSASYVTGSHHAKVGVSWKFGDYGHGGDNNGDISQGYPAFFRDELNNINFPTSTLSDADFSRMFPTRTVRPCAQGAAGVAAGTSASTCSATVRNNPWLSQETLNRDLGIYVQDSWTMKRLTVNAGLRYETLTAQVDEISTAAGRFVPARTAPEIKNIPDWKDWAPRFQVVFDMMGDSRTAIKYSFNRYNESATTSLTSDYNGLGSETSTRNWTDLNGDNIAQGQRTWNADGTAFEDCLYLTPGCEINLSGRAGTTQAALSPTFGLVTDQGEYTGFPREYRLEQGFEIQHALLPRLSLTGSWYHGWNHNDTKTISTARTHDVINGNLNGGVPQYAVVNLFNPIDGTPYVYYNRIVGSFPGSANVEYLEPRIRSEYDSWTGEFQMRPYAGAQLTGGISFERTMTRNCETSRPGAVVDPNSLRFCDDWNLVSYAGGPTHGKPFNKNVKINGAFPLPYGINFGLAYKNESGGNVSPVFLAGSAFRYPDGTSAFRMLGNSANMPACPTTFGCVPGAQTSTTNLVDGAGGTEIGSLFPSGAIRAERVNQLDVKVSKNFRVKMVSIQPALEIFNLMNIDLVRSHQSSTIANASGTYLQPNVMLQGRIIGFGANFKW